MYLSYLETEERKLFLELAYKIANSDRVIVEREEELLESFRDEMNLSHLEYEIQNISLDSILSQLKGSSNHIKRIIFLEALATAFSDGVYDDVESVIIQELRNAFEITDNEYQSFKDCLKQLNKLYEDINNLVYA